VWGCAIRILGIDPGSQITGFGVIEYRGAKPMYIASGCIRVAKAPWSERLVRIDEGLSQVLLQYAPAVVAIEKIFVHKNVCSALKLGHARGVAVVVVAKAGLPIVEYTPRQIKKAVVGYGAAEKSQVQQMMRLLLDLNGLPQQDAADALAVAMCHGQSLRDTTRV
jgi:crossover junction endodeoxyribonuclease RuvC